MIEHIITQFIDAVVGRFNGLLDLVTNPLWGWFAIGFLIFAACVTLGWFFSFLRPFLGIVVVAVGSFLAGAVKMWLRMRDRRR